jgi:hypothetical protein
LFFLFLSFFLNIGAAFFLHLLPFSILFFDQKVLQQGDYQARTQTAEISAAQDR